MIFSNDQKWEKWQIKDELHKFFLLRWQEIFNENTFYSWQVRSCNLRSILSEISEAIDVVDKVHESHPNIKFLIEEANEIAKEDTILTEYFPYVAKYLEYLFKEYDQNVKDDKKKKTDNFRRILNLIIYSLKDYKSKLESKIKERISNPPSSKFQIELYPLIMALGTELIYRGYSITALRESYHLLTNPESGTFSERFVKLLEQFSGKKNGYSCSFMIYWDGEILKSEEISTEHIRISMKHIKEPPKDISVEEREFYNQSAQPTMATIKITAPDHYSAMIESEKILQSFLAFSMLYKATAKKKIIPTEEKFTKTHKKIRIVSDENQKTYIQEDISDLKIRYSSKEFEKDLSNYWKSLFLKNTIASRDTEQLFASLQYHRLAILSSADESKIINLWIALESLVQDGGTNIIGRICNYITASNMTVYIYDMMRATSTNIRKIWRQSDTKELLLKLSEKSSSEKLHPSDVLKILLDKEDGELVKECNSLKLIEDNPLLKNRIGLLRKMFEKPENLAKELERHSKNIEWQLSRIYRARNYVMHNGKCPPRTRHLIRQLHSFYITSVHNLIHDLRKNPEWNIGDAFEYRFHLYSYLKDKLQDKDKSKSKKISAEALFNSEYVLFDSGKSPAWDAKLPPEKSA